MSGHRDEKPGAVSPPANDNEPPLGAVVLIPKDLPIQLVEVEVFAELLDALEELVTNDNEEPGQ